MWNEADLQEMMGSWIYGKIDVHYYSIDLYIERSFAELNMIALEYKLLFLKLFQVCDLPSQFKKHAFHLKIITMLHYVH